MGLLLIKTLPFVGLYNPDNNFNNVVFPLPLGPFIIIIPFFLKDMFILLRIHLLILGYLNQASYATISGSETFTCIIFSLILF